MTLFWRIGINQEELPFFQNVSELAAFVYESGAFIGNDSGVGHLASALNIPTLSILSSKSYSHLWRPSWNKDAVITPPSFYFISSLKKKYWKELLSEKRVLDQFLKFVG